MERTIINISNLTKDYGHGRGVFDICIDVKQGECYGFLGPNGAGKTTTIRHLMGFSKPQQGSTGIMGKDSWDNAAKLKRRIGYIPGEIALPVGITGNGFLKMLRKMHGIGSSSACEELIERFRLDANISTREMSLGEKRKLAIVAAFMHNPGILILDEPTSGLDPVMQQVFIDFIREKKQEGKTIFLSSHIFHEVDATCDRIAIIKSGRIVSEFIARELKDNRDTVYSLQFADRKSYERFISMDYRIVADSAERLKVKVSVRAEELNHFISEAADLDIQTFHQIKYSLEDYFMDFYKEDVSFAEVK